MTVPIEIVELVKKRNIEGLEEIREFLHRTLDGQCQRCGRLLATTHHLDYVNLPEGKVCMLCMGGGFQGEGMTDSINSILIIGGEPALRKELTSVLTKAGFVVADVADYPDALAKLDELSPDMAIVDKVLPGGDGKYACSQLRNVFSIPVILFGKDSSGEAWKAAVEAGADFYFTHSFNRRVLAARVKAILRRYKGLRYN